MNCKYCGTELPDNHAYLIGEKIADIGYGWSYWEDEVAEGDQETIPGLGVVTLVAKAVRFGEDQGEDSRPAFMIFELDGVFYRKNGTANSYGRVDWSTGGFLPALKKIETQVVWE